jgi:hypothetical protein
MKMVSSSKNMSSSTSTTTTTTAAGAKPKSKTVQRRAAAPPYTVDIPRELRIEGSISRVLVNPGNSTLLAETKARNSVYLQITGDAARDASEFLRRANQKGWPGNVSSALLEHLQKEKNICFCCCKREEGNSLRSRPAHKIFQ